MLSVKPRGVVSRAALSALAVLGVCVPNVGAAWSSPAVLVTGDEGSLLATVIRPEGTLRAAIGDTRRGIAMGLTDATGPAAFSDPLVALRTPAAVAQVALAADGSGVALQVQRQASSSVVGFDAAGTLRPPLALDDVGGAAVAVSPGGAAGAAWIAKTPQGYAVVGAFRDPGATTFGAPVQAGYAAARDTIVQIGIGDRGEAVVSWQVNGFPSAVAAAVRLPGAGFSKARFVSRGAIDAQLAVGPGGQAILATPHGAQLDVSVKPPGAAAMPVARRIDRGEGFATGVAASGERQVAMAWLAAPARRGRARVRVYAGAARARGPRRIGTLGRDARGEVVRVAVDARGATVVSWEEALPPKRGNPTARSQLGVAYRPGGRRFGRPTYLGPVALFDTPQSLQVGAGGRAYVLYEAFQPDIGLGSYRRVYVAERRP